MPSGDVMIWCSPALLTATNSPLPYVTEFQEPGAAVCAVHVSPGAAFVDAVGHTETVATAITAIAAMAHRLRIDRTPLPRGRRSLTSSAPPSSLMGQYCPFRIASASTV